MKKIFLSLSLLVGSSVVYAPTFDLEWVVNGVCNQGMIEGGIRLEEKDVTLEEDGKGVCFVKQGCLFSLFKHDQVVHGRVTPLFKPVVHQNSLFQGFIKWWNEDNGQVSLENQHFIIGLPGPKQNPTPCIEGSRGDHSEAYRLKLSLNVDKDSQEKAS